MYWKMVESCKLLRRLVENGDMSQTTIQCSENCRNMAENGENDEILWSVVNGIGPIVINSNGMR